VDAILELDTESTDKVVVMQQEKKEQIRVSVKEHEKQVNRSS